MPKDKNNAAQVDQNVSVKTAVNGGISFEQYKKMLINHYSRHPEYAFVKPMPSVEQMQQNYNNMSDAELIKEYNMYLEQNRADWEMSAVNDGVDKKTLPKWVLNTSNADLIVQFINENYQNLTYEQQYLLNYRVAVAGNIANIQTQAKESFDQGKPFLPLANVKVGVNANNEPTYELEGVSQYSFQSSGNGCWSCFFQVLASSRGVYAPQEQIRAYKPNLSQEAAVKLNDEAFKALNYDQKNSALEMGDSILSFLPNTMLCEVEISSYDETIASKNITPEQYLINCTEKIKKTVTHAILDEHSPVGVLLGNHYITIIGIDGDKVKYKNSIENSDINPNEPDYTFEAPISELFGDVILNEDGTMSALQLTYAKDIKLSKDGRTIFGVPSDYVKMFPDGNISRQPANIRDGAHLMPEDDPPSNINGIQAARTGRVEDTPTEQRMRSTLVDGVLFTEKVYLPKKLDHQYLINSAKNRTLEEENALRQQDEEFYGNKRPAISQAEIDAENMIIAQGQQKPEDVSRELFEQANSTSMAQREEAAKVRMGVILEQSRADGIKKGFEKLAKGTNSKLYDSPIVKDKDFQIEKLDVNQAEGFKNLLVQVMGTDANNTQIGEIHSVYDKFYYKKSPDGEPINVVEDVKQRLIKSEIFGKKAEDLKESVLYNYVAAELLHLASNPNISLSYDNDEFTVNNLKLRETPEISPEVRIFNVNDPVADSDIQLAYDINKLDIPQVTDATLFTSVVGLSREKLDAYSAVYDEIFGKGQRGNIQDVTINIVPDREIDAPREDVHFSTIHSLMREHTPPTAYNKEVWNKQQAFKNGKTYLSADPNDTLKAGKAAIVMALANGMTVKKNGVPVGELSFVAANRAKQKQITDNMKDPELAFLGSVGGKIVPSNYTLDNIRNTLNGITANIEGADNRWFRSSSYYREVKKALKALNKHVNETLSAKIDNDQPITFEDMEKFFAKSDVLRGKMEKYLEHKNKQMLDDPSRKTDPGKQNHEQVRIKNIIRSIENLDTMNKAAEKSVIETMSADAKAYFYSQYSKALLKTKDPYLERKPLKHTFAECADRLDQLDDDFYIRRNKYNSDKESLREARDRIIGAVNKKYNEQFVAEYNKNIKDPVNRLAAEADSEFANNTRRKLSDTEMRTYFNKKKKEYLEGYTTFNYEKDKLAEYKTDLVAYNADESQARSHANATVLSGVNAEKIKVYDNVFAPTPNIKKAFPDPTIQPFTKDEIKKITQINGTFKAIGNGGNGMPLSSKDFAAIAYAACFTDRAYEKVPNRFHRNKDAEINKFKLHYMIEGLDSGKHTKIGRSHGDMIQEGRLMAKEAMEKYAQGDKQMLAELLTVGIKKINKLFKKNRLSISASNIEMAARMKNMLERDPELKAIAESKGLRAEDTRSIESMKKLRQICENADRFANNVAKSSITEDEQIDGVTDYYIQKIIEDQEHRAQNANRTENPYFMKEYNDTYNEALNKINTTEDLRAMDIQSLLFDKAEYLDYKYSPNTPLLESLNDPKNIDELRKNVREMVKNSTLNAPYGEADKLIGKITRYKLVTDVLKNYKKAPETEDGLYDLSTESGYIRNYIRENKEEAKERQRLAGTVGYDEKKYEDLLEKVNDKLKHQGTKKTATATTNVTANDNTTVKDNTIKHI